MELRLVSQTNTTITLGWDEPVVGCIGYRFDSEKQEKPSHTWDARRTTVRFAKGSAWYRIDPLFAHHSATWPASALVPPQSVSPALLPR